MSRLVTRGTSKTALFSSTDATAFMDRSRQPHTIKWVGKVYRYGTSGALIENIPIVGGTLTMDSSDPIRRKLTLEVGAGSALEPRDWNDPLVPFGQYISLFMTIDRADGSLFPWLKMGEFQIRSYVYEIPSQIATVEAWDHSIVVDEYLHTSEKSYANRSVAGAIVTMCQDALPNSLLARDVHPSAWNEKVAKGVAVAQAASSRWEQCVKIAEASAYDTFFDWAGDIVIRPNIGDGNDDIIPENGPDVGTKASPITAIWEGNGGNLIGMTSTVTREGAANGVFINVHETADQKDKKARGDKRVNVQVKSLPNSGSPVAYGDKFGRIPLVYNKTTPKITDAVVAAWQKTADSKLTRRRGVVRYIDVAMVGGYWLEPDDKVQIKWEPKDHGIFARVEDHYVQSIVFDLTGGATRVRTRQLNVIDPGA